MASIRPYRTANGERRYEAATGTATDGSARARSRPTRTRRPSRSTSSAGSRRALYRAAPERFRETVEAWLERYERRRRRPGPAAAEDVA